MQRQITSKVVVETGVKGCNHGFVMTTEGIVMIDSPQLPSHAVRWRDVMRDKGEIRYLINTEPHRDHVTGNFFFPGAVISHEGTRQALASVTTDAIRELTGQYDPEGLSLEVCDKRYLEEQAAFIREWMAAVGDAIEIDDLLIMRRSTDDG